MSPELTTVILALIALLGDQLRHRRVPRESRETARAVRLLTVKLNQHLEEHTR